MATPHAICICLNLLYSSARYSSQPESIRQCLTEPPSPYKSHHLSHVESSVSRATLPPSSPLLSYPVCRCSPSGCEAPSGWTRGAGTGKTALSVAPFPWSHEAWERTVQNRNADLFRHRKKGYCSLQIRRPFFRIRRPHFCSMSLSSWSFNNHLHPPVLLQHH